MKKDKRFSFPFGANSMEHIVDRLGEVGIKLRLDGEQLFGAKRGKIPAWAGDLIKENKSALIEWLKAEDQRKREAALAKLPFAEFQNGPVELRTVYLLKLFEDYLAVTEEELAMLDGSAHATLVAS